MIVGDNSGSGSGPDAIAKAQAVVASARVRYDAELMDRVPDLRVTGGGWQTSEVFDCPPQDLLELCVQRGLEGVVAKRAASRYLPGRRSSDWVKLKTPQWRREHSGRRRPAA